MIKTNYGYTDRYVSSNKLPNYVIGKNSFKKDDEEKMNCVVLGAIVLWKNILG